MPNYNPKTAHLKKFRRLDNNGEPLAATLVVRVTEEIASALKKLTPLERGAFLRRAVTEAVRKELLNKDC